MRCMYFYFFSRKYKTLIHITHVRHVGWSRYGDRTLIIHNFTQKRHNNIEEFLKFNIFQQKVYLLIQRSATNKGTYCVKCVVRYALHKEIEEKIFMLKYLLATKNISVGLEKGAIAPKFFYSSILEILRSKTNLLKRHIFPKY